MSTSESAPASATRKVLIVDDHPLIRQGIGAVVNGQSDLEICGEAESAAEALRAIADETPDVAVVDLTLKESSGLELIKDIRIRHPDVKILVLSMRDEGYYAERTLRAGAMGYVTKEEGPRKVLEGIRKILDGQIYVSEKMASKVMGRLVGGRHDATATAMDELSDRELEVFELLGNGSTTREIADRVHISPKTVDSHREHIKEKLGLGGAAELLRHAIEWAQCRHNG